MYLRNKFVLNPGCGIYKEENIVFSTVSSLRSWRYVTVVTLFIWRLRNLVYLAQMCISNDRAVMAGHPTPNSLF